MFKVYLGDEELRFSSQESVQSTQSDINSTLRQNQDKLNYQNLLQTYVLNLEEDDFTDNS